MSSDKSFGCRFANTEKCADSCFKCELFHRDYISRDEANEALRECVRAYSNRYYQGIEVAISAIIKLPAADVVEVVRCKDCSHNCGEGFVGGTISCGLSNLFTVGKDPMDFCSSGERRTDDG